MNTPTLKRQEVNLYTLEFRRGDQAFSARFLIKVCIGVFVGLMLLEALVAWNFIKNKDQLHNLQSQQQVVAQRLSLLKQTQPLSQRPKLQVQINLLEQQVKQRQQLQAIIGGQKIGNFDGFASYLTSIARQADPEMSLTHIRLLNGGAYLELQGWARKAESVPSYLQRLRQEPSFEGVRFGVLKIEKNTSYSNRVQFYLGQGEDGPT